MLTRLGFGGGISRVVHRHHVHNCGIHISRVAMQDSSVKETPAQREQRLKRKRAWAARRTPDQKARDSALQKAWRLRNPERVKRSMKEWAQCNREYLREYFQSYWSVRRDKQRAKSKRMYRQNAVNRIAQIKRYKLANRERLREAQRIYDARPDRRAKRAACTKRWLQAHPEVQKARAALRKARIRGAAGGTRGANVMIRRWKKLKTFVCYYCQNKFPVKYLHIDHILAVVNGGKHAEDNLCAACATCNLKKRALPVAELIFVPQRLLSL